MGRSFFWFGLLVFSLIAVLMFPSEVVAKSGHMKLLAVRETPQGYEGSDADLFLEIRRGQGRVYLDTLPLTKVDTQISTRFAKQVACGYLDINCDNLDFFYTIRSDSSIVGGPSAGAAIAVLTVSLLEGTPLREDVAMTGTINSGGVIGVVDGVKEKVQVAKELGARKILIAHGTTILKESGNESSNETLDLAAYGKSIGIEVVEVATLDEALFEFTGVRRVRPDVQIVQTQRYKDTMMELALLLCKKSDEYDRVIGELSAGISLSDEHLNALMTQANNLSGKARAALEAENTYSAASFCYGSNVKKGELILRVQDLSDDEIGVKWKELKAQALAFRNEVKVQPLTTLENLQAYIIVMERIDESLAIIDDKKAHGNVGALAYAAERLYSAYAWSHFFDGDGQSITLNDRIIKDSCIVKLAEADERYQYVGLLFPGALQDTREEIERARKNLEEGDFALCLFRASKAKAEANSVMNALGVSGSQVNGFLKLKSRIAEQEIAQEAHKGTFPILAFSYYQYAQDLKETDEFSALLYLDYALEMSDLEAYLREQNRIWVVGFDAEKIALFTIGVLAGAVVAVMLMLKRHRRISSRMAGNQKKVSVTVRGKKRKKERSSER